MRETLKHYAGLWFNMLPRRVKIVLLLGAVVGYNAVFIAYLLFIGGMLPYLIFFHGKG